MTYSRNGSSNPAVPDARDKERARGSRGSEPTAADLERALHAGELTLLYQPIVSADGRRLVCAEALARWTRPGGEIVPPDVFIPLAERSGLIGALGCWVLREACLQARAWPGMRLAVNMSPLQLQDEAFVPHVREILDETGFPADLLELELTESAVLSDIVNASHEMATLRRHGVRLALDDFGTGYSGLIYLRRLPLDKIKIDREFLQSLSASGEAAILLRSMVRLGRDLGMTVTAEGVEEGSEQAILADAGCHELQGFLFARPLPPAVIGAMVARQNAGEPLIYANGATAPVA